MRSRIHSDVFRAPPLTRLSEYFREPGSLVGRHVLEQMDQHERAFAFLDVTIEFLAVLGRIPDQVEQVVLDLEGGAGEKTRIEMNRIEVRGCRVSRSAPLHASEKSSCTSRSS